MGVCASLGDWRVAGWIYIFLANRLLKMRISVESSNEETVPIRIPRYLVEKVIYFHSTDLFADEKLMKGKRMDADLTQTD